MKKLSRIFLASANPNKIQELQEMLSPLEIELRSTLDIEENVEVVEDLPTLEGNALKKAKFWYQRTGIPSLSDDTGLEVEALGGEPGVYSARYAGPDATYEDNVLKLLEEMKGIENRSARFRTVVALVSEKELLFEGVCEGEIISQPRGEKGFGYDPVFLPDGFNRTFAELNAEEKNRISHRGRALQKLIGFLEDEPE
ncbi:MAG: RdgB/HAM1 family non-canonical purine NTP pyrophosphatase [Balneolaceae bacterium]